MFLVAVTLFSQLAVPARHQAPVLEFPQAGLDDSASYQGYQTRFYKDAARNTVQIYIDQRAGRVVHLLANSEDESAGFTVRGPDGPVPLRWTSPNADVSTLGRKHLLAHELAAAAPDIRIGWFVLGSMRVERDFQYQQGHTAPFAIQPFVLPEMTRFAAALERLQARERRRHLARLNATSPASVRARLAPSFATSTSTQRWIARVMQPSLDGRDTVSVEIIVDPARVTATRTAGYLQLRARQGTEVPFTVRVSSTARALTPLSRSEIFNGDFLSFLAEADTATTRGKWLERQVRGVELLSSREKLMAGLPAYATYFGRDMLVSALMMHPIWRDEMSEFVIASALRKLSRRGEVSHEEALGGQAAREAAMDYTRLLDSASVARGRGDAIATAAWLERAYTLLGNMRRVRENYHMIDDEFQFAVVAGRWLSDPRVSRASKRAFLTDSRDSGEPRLRRLLREFALVARMTAAYAANPVAINLVSFPRRDDGGWSSASWRDSGAGYAGGRFAMDVNALWAPHALEAIAEAIAFLPALGFSPDSLIRSMPELTGDSPMGTYLRDSVALDRAITTWWGAEKHFLVRLTPTEVRQRVSQRLASMSDVERSHWTRVLGSTGADTAGVEFLALALDAEGNPIAVANTDPGTGLFLGPSRRLPVSPAGVQDATLRDVRLFERAYPVGLFIDRVGPVVANDAYAPPAVWPVFERDRYHGPRVVWGREVNLFLLGVAGRIASAARTGISDDSYIGELRAAIDRVMEAVRSSGFRSELWSYDFQNGVPVPVRYGTGSDVQLWSTTDLAVQYALSRLQPSASR